ncbi:MAG: polysaccharide deacetylase family protein [Armatimonadota bacterium]
MRNLYKVLVWAVALLVISTALPPQAGASSENRIAETLDALELGRTNESFSILEEVLEINPNHTLSHVVMGYTLLLGGRLDQALQEFEIAIKTDPNCAIASYGRGLVLLKKRLWNESKKCFIKAQSLEPIRNLEPIIRYVEIMELKNRCNEIDPNASSPTNDEAETALRAMFLMNAGKYKEALPLWMHLQSRAADEGYSERVGCTMTFLPQNPLAITGEPLKAVLFSHIAPARVVKSVTGKIVLRADLSRAQDVRIVTFIIDDQMIGVTNREPFECVWDTTRWPNGPHAVKIIGRDAWGAVASEKTTLVMVENPDVSAVSGATPSDLALRKRLWKLMLLKPSSATINYQLALCARRMGSLETEKIALERVVAACPDYKDASHRLSELYRRANASTGTIRIMNTGAKSIALTFDDGPKPETDLLLDVLKDKGVQATFFVVGKQCEKYPDQLKRIFDEGHSIGNHTYTHSALEFLPSQMIEREIFACQAAVRAITGREMRLIRPPGAHTGKKLESVARKFGMKIVLYSHNCSEVEGTSAEKVVKHVVNSAHPGAVILMHNLDRVTLQAIPRIVDILKAKGYSFVTL